MTQKIDDKGLSQRFLTTNTADSSEPSEAQTDDAVAAAIKTANMQTGGRDTAVLFITSAFSILLIFFAPIASLIARKQSEKSCSD